MKSLSSISYSQATSIAGRLRPAIYRLKSTGNNLTGPQQSNAGVLIGLMMPVMMMSLNFSMFGVALPAIRDYFDIQADMTAWLMTAYTLPFMIFMPLYGRLGDGLGKRRLFLIGVLVFIAGTGVTLLASNLGWLMVGLATQGIGAAAISPLSIAIIVQLFPLGERGKTLGTWSSMAPLMGIIGPLLAGLMIDHLGGWRTIFVPVLAIGLAALIILFRKIPATSGAITVNPAFLRTFDWGGVVFLSVGVTTIIFFTSSRPVTGIAALQDWRLLAAALLLVAIFITWEKRRTNPFVPFSIFAYKTFRTVSLCAAVRMFSMTGIVFLIPLYLSDVYALSAASIGAMLMVHAGALLATLRLGGQLADRWGSRRPVVAGLSLQAGVMVYLALLPSTVPLGLIIVPLVFHGLGAGLSFAALDRAAMDKIPLEQTGMAAGLYSMIRLSGFVLGTALAGVLLQNRLEQLSSPIQAYQVVFGFIAGVALLGVFLGLGLRE